MKIVIIALICSFVFVSAIKNPGKEDPGGEDFDKEDPSKEDRSQKVLSKEVDRKEDPNKKVPNKDDHSKKVPSKKVPSKHDPSEKVPGKEDPNLKPANNIFPKLVKIQDGNQTICTGSLILDNTVLSSSPCIFASGSNRPKWTISFLNDKKKYKVIDANRTDGDLVLLMMDKNENPPKSEWKVNFRRTDTYEGRTKMLLIRSDKNKDKMITPVGVSTSKLGCEVAQVPNARSNMTRTICIEGQQPWGFVDGGDRGAPLFYDKEFTGVLMTEESSDFPTAFEKIFFHLDFIDKYLKGSDKDKNPIKKEVKKGPKKLPN